MFAEIMDFGYPQNLAPEMLKLYITQQWFKNPFSKVSLCPEPPPILPQFFLTPSLSPVQKEEIPVAPNATLQVTGAVGWRREGLYYKKNEVFLDIVESVNLLMSQNGESRVLLPTPPQWVPLCCSHPPAVLASAGSVLRCDVSGKILMKCFLSGMPDLKLGLNDKIGLEKEAQARARPTRGYLRDWPCSQTAGSPS